MTRRSAWMAAVLTVALALFGCARGEEHPEDHAENGGTQTTAASGAGTTGGTQAGDDGGADGEGSGEHEHHNADFPAAEATDTAKISMRDFVFVDLPAAVTGPKLRIEAKNNGPSAHEIVVFDADGNEVGGADPIPPDDEAELSLELTAGTYEMRCLIPISATETHLDRGMKAVFQVM